MRIVHCQLLLLAHCAVHSWDRGNARLHTAIGRRSNREKGDDDTGYVRQPGYARTYMRIIMAPVEGQTVIYGRQAPMNRTSH